jgi:transposase
MKITEKEPSLQHSLDNWTGGTVIEPFNWRAYNNSQTREKVMFLELLNDLCNVLDENSYCGTGRKPKSLSHQVFCVCLREYVGLSSRRVISDLEISKRNHFISETPHFNTVLNYLGNINVKRALIYLIQLSALPLAQLEDKFAIDSTGFGERKYIEKWSSVRQKPYMYRLYRKAHCIYGTYSNAVVSAIITEGTEADSPKFIELLNNASKNFDVKEITADLGYSSRENMKYAEQLGVTPYIPFKKNATGTSRGATIWHKMYKYFKDNREEFLKHYHIRSNAESGFFMIKSRFGDFVKTKTSLSQTNEILAKILCHNICVLIQEIYLSNIDIDFISSAEKYRDPKTNF